MNRRNLGGIVARPVCVGKGSGIWEGLAASYLEVTLNPRYILLEKTQGIVGLVRRAFPLKKIRNPGGWPHHIFIFNYIELKGYFISEKHKEVSGGSVQRAFSLETTRNPGGREQSHVSSQSTCTRPFIFAAWWRRCEQGREMGWDVRFPSSRTHGCDVQTFLKTST